MAVVTRSQTKARLASSSLSVRSRRSKSETSQRSRLDPTVSSSKKGEVSEKSDHVDVPHALRLLRCRPEKGILRKRRTRSRRGIKKHVRFNLHANRRHSYPQETQWNAPAELMPGGRTGHPKKRGTKLEQGLQFLVGVIGPKRRAKKQKKSRTSRSRERSQSSSRSEASNSSSSESTSQRTSSSRGNCQ
uniref:ORF3 n=1 Tax=Steinernema glaseri TaxID=37863 RepID=A0A1I7ZI89_9BILA